MNKFFLGIGLSMLIVGVRLSILSQKSIDYIIQSRDFGSLILMQIVSMVYLGIGCKFFIEVLIDVIKEIKKS